jgi:flagellar motility protein MotE (MotC chaperone)
MKYIIFVRKKTYHKLKRNHAELKNEQNNLRKQCEKLRGELEHEKLHAKDKYQQKINESEKKISILKSQLSTIQNLAKETLEQIEHNRGASASSGNLY